MKNINSYILFDDFDFNSFNSSVFNKNYVNKSSTFNVNKNSSPSDDTFDENVKNLFKMKLRSTVADSQFIEQSANNMGSKYTKDYDNEDIFDISYSYDNYSPDLDSGAKNFEPNYVKSGPFDKTIDNFSTNDSFYSDLYKEECNIGDEMGYINYPKFQHNLFRDKKFTSNKFDKRNSNNIISSLKDITKQIEYNNNRNITKITKYEDQIMYLNSQINNLNRELDTAYKNLDIALKELEEKSTMENRILELESHVRQLVSMLRECGTDLKDPFVDDNKTTDASTTVPSITVDYNDMDEKSKVFAYKLIKYLYSDIDDSENPLFLANLYKSLKEIPDAVHCVDVVKFIQESIRRDSRVVESSLLQGLIVSDDQKYTDDFLSVPQSNYERQLISELETKVQYHPNQESTYDSSTNDHHLKKYYNNHSCVNVVNDDLSCAKTHVIMNRSVIAAIFKASNMNNLYNYLFEALYCDNFRIVEIIGNAVFSKFMDLEMIPKFSSKVRHPIIWAFGPSIDPNRAQRYIKMLNYNFSNFPTDPTTGENLWHMVAKGNGIVLAEKLRAFSIYTSYINHSNNDNMSPLDISEANMKKEFYLNLIVDLACKGAEMYKKGCYEKALEHYNQAIQLQTQLMNENGSEDCDSSTNMGKLYYNKARTLMHLGRWTDAIESCENCLKYIPNYYNAYDTCVQAYENLLDWENAALTCISMRENCGLINENRYQRILDQRDATFFQLLDLDKSASSSEIKKAFNTMCKLWHPDKNAQSQSEDMKKRCINHFNRLFEARERLMDPTTKSIHQMKRETNYKIPTPFINQEKTEEDCRECGSEQAGSVESREQSESSKCVQSNGRVEETARKIQKNSHIEFLRSRDNLKELTMERLKFIDSINLLKGQAMFDFDSFSWGQV